jgi:hypothetical protein
MEMAEELPGVRAEAFHVAPLAFGVQGVEGQAGLAAAGQAGDHHQLVPGQGQIQVLEVVLPGPSNDDVVHADLEPAVYAIFS